jgi:hypothetical protein
MQTLSAFRGAGPLMIGETLFQNCFESVMIRNLLRLRAASVSRRRSPNESARLSLREIQILMKLKQFHGRHDWQKQFNQMMTSQCSAACLVEHLVKNQKKMSRAHAVFL